MQDMEQEIKEFLKERSWDHLRPSDLAKSIAIEAAELLEIFQWKSRTIEEAKADAKDMQHLKSELADVLIYCFEMAVLLGIDVREIMQSKLQHARKKYPAELMRAIGNKEHGTQEEYLSIKAEYRKKGL